MGVEWYLECMFALDQMEHCRWCWVLERSMPGTWHVRCTVGTVVDGTGTQLLTNPREKLVVFVLLLGAVRCALDVGALRMAVTRVVAMLMQADVVVVKEDVMESWVAAVVVVAP